jgi:HEAT repeat protein
VASHRAPLFAIALFACAPSPVPSTVDADSLVFGGSKCRSGADCPIGVCSIGMCMGYLTLGTPIQREAVADRLREAGRDPALGPGLAGTLSGILAEPEADAFLRARAAEALGLLGQARLLGAYLEDPDEPVRFAAARALHEAGDDRGTRMLEGFLTHEAPAVRELAKRILGR